MNTLVLIGTVVIAVAAVTVLQAVTEVVVLRCKRRKAINRIALNICKNMLDGQRFVVVKPPDGMTVHEAQAEVDQIWASLQVRHHRGTGGKVN